MHRLLRQLVGKPGLAHQFHVSLYHGSVFERRRSPPLLDREVGVVAEEIQRRGTSLIPAAHGRVDHDKTSETEDIVRSARKEFFIHPDSILVSTNESVRVGRILIVEIRRIQRGETECILNDWDGLLSGDPFFFQAL